MPHTLSLTKSLYDDLRTHLYPDDGFESVAVMLCHSGIGKLGLRLMANQLMLVDTELCYERSSNRLCWPFASCFNPEKISEIDELGLSIMTIHSHPSGFSDFSEIDDKNDCELFSSVCSWFDDDRPNGSAIMLPNGQILARLVNHAGKFTSIQTVSVIGEDISIWKQNSIGRKVPSFGSRIAQTFGKGTYQLLRKIRAGVVGCSGSGSIVVELLSRNCIGHLVIVDPDDVETKNLNRVINSTKADARKKTPKVELLKRSVRRMGMGTEVDALKSDTRDRQVIEALADCDVLFGCVDSAEGRYHLECIASAYFIPYFDVGVNLESDDMGNILQADAVSHYMHPNNTSLMARGGYTTEQVTAESWHRTNRGYYERQRVAGYLADISEDQPAVMSINMQAACLAFNDFIARLHNFRLDSNDDFSTQRFRFVHGYSENLGNKVTVDSLFSKFSGKGERSDLIKMLKGRGSLIPEGSATVQSIKAEVGG
ncbi:MAG: ThiF family adenylyltransferase [Gammaproteobacteria bacterium]|nr:ThiF family adenylyltransferase [Gammaproteobacteria bacterium]MCY4229050.1 ThiF family adenylyltransferase [Gammaproteobacteria bacterium]